MDNNEIRNLEKSIREAREAIDSGLVLDPEARSTLYRMIIYYEEKLEKEKRNRNS